MKRAIILNIAAVILFLPACDNTEFSSIYPANPPVGLELILLASPGNLDPAYSAYSGDYLLLFRSENTKNTRFGGFLAFVDPAESNVLEMETEAEASYMFGIIEGEETSPYNKGIDTVIAILFTDNGETGTITVDNTEYTVAAVRGKASLTSGWWLAVRTYLYDAANSEILETSSPGYAVQIQ